MGRPFIDLNDFRRIAVHDLRPFAEEVKERLAAEWKGELSWKVRRNLGAVETVLAMTYAMDRHQTILWDPDYLHSVGSMVGEDFPFAQLFHPPTPARQANGAGHYGSAASQAVGLAQARRVTGQPGSAAAFLTRDSIFNGQTFEAMNHAGHMKLPVLMTFHDLSISIGYKERHIASFISSQLARSRIVGAKRGVRRILEKLPGVGQELSQMAHRADESFVGFMTPGMLFEAFDFTYVGPLDGSDIELLVETFRQAAGAQQPLFIHVATPFDRDRNLLERVRVKSGGGVPQPPANLERMLSRLCSADPKAVVVESQPMALKKLDRLETAFPDRYLYAGSGLQHAATLCAGMACEGLRPVLVAQADAIARAFDSIVHDLAIQRLPLALILRRTKEDATPMESWARLFEPIPNVRLAYPTGPEQIVPMLSLAIEEEGITILMVEDELLVGAESPADETELLMGEARRIGEGEGLTLAYTGPLGAICEEATRQLADLGVEAGVLEFPYIKPLDADALAEESERPIFVIEPGSRSDRLGPLAGAIAALSDSQPDRWPEISGFCNVSRPFSTEGAVRIILDRLGVREASQNGSVIKLRPSSPLKKAKG